MRNMKKIRSLYNEIGKLESKRKGTREKREKKKNKGKRKKQLWETNNEGRENIA